MIFEETELTGAWLIRPEPHEDERGSFTRIFCQRELAAHGLTPTVAQASLSRNHRAGTLRGMHWQAPPFEEAKLVRVVRGAIFDALVDLRPTSPTRGRYATATLSADNGHALYVPPGFAHGFQTLEDDTELLYMISEFYRGGTGRGFRYDDPEVGIPWPRQVTVISEKDAALPRLAEVEAGG